MSPDWSAKEEPVPYAKLDNPQSLNLYAYVGNNPVSKLDQDGHQEVPEAETEPLVEFLRTMRNALSPEAYERAVEMARNPGSPLPEAESFNQRYLSGSGGRWGGSPTRVLNSTLSDGLEYEGYRITNGGGRGPEEWIPGPGGKAEGGTYVDITAKKGSETIRIQTVTTLADGKTPTPAEQAAAARIRQAFPKDRLYLIPKPQPTPPKLVPPPPKVQTK